MKKINVDADYHYEQMPYDANTICFVLDDISMSNFYYIDNNTQTLYINGDNEGTGMIYLAGNFAGATFSSQY